MGVFRFIARAIGQGVGTGNQAFAGANDPAPHGGIHFVSRGTLGPTAPGFVKLNQQLVPATVFGQQNPGTHGQFVGQTLATKKG